MNKKIKNNHSINKGGYFMRFKKRKILNYKKNKVRYYKENYTNKELIRKIDKLIYLLDKRNITKNIEIFQDKRKLILRNFFAGVTKGIGTGIGFTILTAIIIYILQYIIRLNIPVIGNYINDILDIVQKQ